MTIEDLHALLNVLPKHTVLFGEQEDVLEVEAIKIERFSDGRCHLIFSSLD